jgi:hypothetical protein
MPLSNRPHRDLFSAAKSPGNFESFIRAAAAQSFSYIWLN